jgi:hypothetical protein
LGSKNLDESEDLRILATSLSSESCQKPPPFPANLKPAYPPHFPTSEDLKTIPSYIQQQKPLTFTCPLIPFPSFHPSIHPLPPSFASPHIHHYIPYHFSKALTLPFPVSTLQPPKKRHRNTAEHPLMSHIFQQFSPKTCSSL